MVAGVCVLADDLKPGRIKFRRLKSKYVQQLLLHFDLFLIFCNDFGRDTVDYEEESVCERARQQNTWHFYFVCSRIWYLVSWKKKKV